MSRNFDLTITTNSNTKSRSNIEYIVFSTTELNLQDAVYYENIGIYEWSKFKKLLKYDIYPLLDSNTRNELQSYRSRERLLKKLGAYGPYDDYYHALMVRERVMENIIPSPISTPKFSPINSPRQNVSSPHFIQVISRSPGNIRIHHRMFEE